MRTRLLLLACVSCLTACATMRAPVTNEARTAAWFEAQRGRPPMLRMFLQRMPKGGDIHVHLTGSVYAESYIEWAAAAELCASPTGAIGACSPPGEDRLVADALRDPGFYAAIVDGLSTRNLSNRRQSGHDQFFGAFGRFRDATKDRYPDMLAELTRRAADQHVSYLEIMLTLGGDGPWTLIPRVRFDAADLAASRQQLLDAGLAGVVAAARAELDDLERKVSGLLGCGPLPTPPACRVERRYLQQSSRISEPNVVFTQLTFAFALAAAEPRVVGVNLVSPEDYPLARRDYARHMGMIGWLTKVHGGAVKAALHAGELTLGLVPPDDLRFHIRQAVEVAGARRIGHGVSIAYERDAIPLLAELRRRDVLVEICLTSNDVILGVRGPRHPFPDYLAAGVPVALATDDEGVSRIDLSHEYTRAAETYGLGYRQLKGLARNSLTYSFLPGASLWTSAACAADAPAGAPSPACQSFLAGSEKARLQWDLERAFHDFEATPWPAADGR